GAAAEEPAPLIVSPATATAACVRARMPAAVASTRTMRVDEQDMANGVEELKGWTALGENPGIIGCSSVSLRARREEFLARPTHVNRRVRSFAAILRRLVGSRFAQGADCSQDRAIGNGARQWSPGSKGFRAASIELFQNAGARKTSE